MTVKKKSENNSKKNNQSETKTTTKKDPAFGMIGFNAGNSSGGTTPFQKKKSSSLTQREKEKKLKKKSIMINKILRCLTACFECTMNINHKYHALNDSDSEDDNVVADYYSFLSNIIEQSKILNIIRTQLLSASSGGEIESNPQKFSTTIGLMLSLSNINYVLKAINLKKKNEKDTIEKLLSIFHDRVIALITLLSSKNKDSTSEKDSISEKEDDKNDKNDKSDKSDESNENDKNDKNGNDGNDGDDDNIDEESSQLISILIKASDQMSSRSFLSIPSPSSFSLLTSSICTCDKGHKMKKEIRECNNCDLCLNEKNIKTCSSSGGKGTSYRCTMQCDYDVCEECWIKEMNMKASNGYIQWPPKCQKGHEMTISKYKE